MGAVEAAPAVAVAVEQEPMEGEDPMVAQPLVIAEYIDWRTNYEIFISQN
jgi:hypothetical protein